MKFDKAWVAQFAQCPDGTAWGLDFTKDGPKSLYEALHGLTRADWLLWYMVKSDTITLEMAHDLLWELLPTSLAGAESLDFLSILADKTAPVEVSVAFVNRERITRVRGLAAAAGESLIFTGETGRGHEVLTVAFMARLQLHLLELDADEALKDGQCVLNNIVAAGTGSLNFETPKARKIHGHLCEWLRARVVVQKGRA